LETISAGGESNEFLTLEYAGGSKLYVPVSSLHLISRYAGTDEEHAPLHKLGTDRWSNAKQKALEKIRDTAAELLDVYARREARKRFQFENPKEASRAFAAVHRFARSPSQNVCSQSVYDVMTTEQPLVGRGCDFGSIKNSQVVIQAVHLAA